MLEGRLKVKGHLTLYPRTLATNILTKMRSTFPDFVPIQFSDFLGAMPPTQSSYGPDEASGCSVRDALRGDGLCRDAPTLTEDQVRIISRSLSLLGHVASFSHGG